MKILVTGANGYLGQGIVKEILNSGNKVVATDFSTTNIDPRAKKVEANLFEIDDPFNYFDQPDVVLHLAWKDGFVHDSMAHLDNLPLHYKFLEKMIDANIKRICVMGTMHEVGFYEGSIDENTPCNPMSLYGISKNALREAVKALTQNSNTIFQWLRGYYIVGNTKYGASIFSKIAFAESKGQKKFPFTSGLNQYDFLDYSDFCKQVAAAVGQDKIDGIINICSGRPEKLSDRVEKFIRENNFKIKLDYGKYPDRPYDSKAVWGNNKKIAKILS